MADFKFDRFLDLNFITIHGKSKFPGLYVWRRDGQRAAVKIPDGCFLIQAGKQLQYVSAGYFYAGYHEVIVSDDTLAAAEKAKQEGRSTWRVSSTMFSGFEYNQDLAPFKEFAHLVSQFCWKIESY